MITYQISVIVLAVACVLVAFVVTVQRGLR